MLSIHPAQAGPRIRVIVDTDAKNEADDQYAIVHAALTPMFDLRGVIAAHYGTRRHPQSMRQSRLEVDKLYDLMGLRPDYPIVDGAEAALADERSPSGSEGAELIIREALRDDTDTPLFVAFFGPLTEMASALLMAPEIAERDVTVVWIGGGPYPDGGQEYNLSNDIAAANVVFDSPVRLWQVPSSTYKLMAVSYAELMVKVAPHGDLGAYLVDQLVEWNAGHGTSMIEHRSLGDSPAVGLMMYPDAGRWYERPAPRFDAEQRYVDNPGARPIRVYDTVDIRFIQEDLFAKLALWSRGR